MSDTETVLPEEEEAEAVEDAEAPSEETPEPTEDGDDESSEDEPGEDEAEEPKPKKRRNAQKRISQLTRARHNAEREAQELRQQLDALQSTAAPAAEPKQEDFQSYDDYYLARAEFRADQAVTRKLGELANTIQQNQESSERAILAADWEVQVENARDSYDDFDDVVLIDTNPVTDAMAQAYAQTNNGADVAYHIASHPKLAREISGLSPTQAVLRIGALSAKLAAKPVPKQTSAPKPVKTVGGGRASPQKDPSKMNQKDFEAWMDKREKK